MDIFDPSIIKVRDLKRALKDIDDEEIVYIQYINEEEEENIMKLYILNNMKKYLASYINENIDG